MSSSPSTVDAAAALVAAWGEKHASNPSRNEVAFPLAQLMGEGSLSRYFLGTNNFGAMHATKGFAAKHARDPGYGMVAFLDHGGSGVYISRMAVYPSRLAGARDFLDLVERDVPLSQVGSEQDYALYLYSRGYFEGFSTPTTPMADRAYALANDSWTDADRTNIAQYAQLIAQNVPAADRALVAATSSGIDSSVYTAGPPFAPLAERLTPSEQYRPHTIEHARALLGDAANHPPPGGISLDEALAAAAGDGYWMFASTPASTTRVAAEVFIGAALGVALGAGAWAGVRTLQGRPVFA